jgi:hypothetical protein
MSDEQGRAAKKRVYQSEQYAAYDRHMVTGRIGRLAAMVSPEGEKVVCLTMEEVDEKNDAHSDPVFHQIIATGRDVEKIQAMGMKSGDLVLFSLTDLLARAYLDRSSDPPRAVGYLESYGFDPLILERAVRPEGGGPEEKPWRLQRRP